MKILALDLGTTAGVALMREAALIRVQTLRLPRADPAVAYRMMHEHVASLIDIDPLHRPALVAYEDVPAQAHAGGIAAHRWGGYEACVLLACALRGVPYLGVKPAAWKRAAGLRAGSGPDEALVAARRRWTALAFATADAAVAAWVAVVAQDTLRRSVS